MDSAQAYIDARAFARSRLASFRDEPIDLFGCEFLWLDPDGNRQFAVHLLKRQAESGRAGIRQTLSDAVERRWDLADAALREIIEESDRAGRDLSDELAWYRDVIARGWTARRKGRQRAPQAMRDIALAIVLTELVERYGLLPTESDAGANGRSACSAVTEAWQAEINSMLGYKRIEGIWNRWGPGILSNEASARLYG
jgi:hypothetical protein